MSKTLTSFFNFKNNKVFPSNKINKYSQKVIDNTKKCTKNAMVKPTSKILSSVKGFVNKGQTCYANAILQALNAVPEIWINCTLPNPSSSNVSRINKTVLQIMSLMDRPNTFESLDPSGFLWALQSKYHSSGQTEFSFNSQHDVVQVLEVVLDELSSSSLLAANVTTSEVKISTTCNTCFCTSDNIDFLPILSLPLTNSVSSSIYKYISSEFLEGDNSWFCFGCQEKRESIRDTTFSSCGNILIVQLRRFNFSNGRAAKDDRFVNCYLTLEIPHIIEGEVSFRQNYDLKAVINHSGTLEAGHYWTAVYHQKSKCWLSCDDKTITRISKDKVSTRHAYVLFYKKSGA